VLVRTPGGAYEDAWRVAAWEPFAAETGIRVVPIATNAAKILAMVESGNVELDLLDLGEFQTILLQRLGALDPIDRGRFTQTDLADIDPVREFYTGNNVFATVLGYNKEAFPARHPTNWAEFWDAATFPGARMLEDMAAGAVNLEFALLADGVPLDRLYPIDLDRAFKKLREIRRAVVKWWDSGAVSAQLLADKQAVLGSIWNGRIQVLIDQGAPLAIEWNQSERVLQGFSILKGAPNRDNAYRLLDYALSPRVQARFAQNIAYGPVNRKAFEFVDNASAAKLPTTPERIAMSYANDAAWWVDNQKRVADLWQDFLLET
jgi:putative spermidine/putrescine transport system substrate-binding protein